MEQSSQPINWAPFFLRYILPIALLVLLSTLLISRCNRLPLPEAEEAFVGMAREEGKQKMLYRGSYNRDFNDLNEIQLQRARKIGIQPMRTREDLSDRMPDLVQIISNDHYHIAKLTHSVPYLIPEAKELLDEIGDRFNHKLRTYGQRQYRLLVTSVTRTLEDVASLSRSNVNASPNSTHCYGTTVDVSWRRFAEPTVDRSTTLEEDIITPDHLKAVLAQVLKELHDEGRCYIKHERRQACFHITVR